MAKKLRTDWSQWDHLLGVKSDKELAQILGCSPENIRYRRKKFSIPPAVNATWTEDDEKRISLGLLKCVKCSKTKPLEEFHKENNRRTGTHRSCKSCWALVKKKKWQQSKSEFTSMLGSECQNCRYHRYLSPLQFHHVNSDNKEHTLSRLICHESRRDEVLEELDKCCLLCSNCHDAFHAEELNLKFNKQPFGWTVSNPQKVGSPSKITRSEDKGIYHELMLEN